MEDVVLTYLVRSLWNKWKWTYTQIRDVQRGQYQSFSLTVFLEHFASRCLRAVMLALPIKNDHGPRRCCYDCT